MLQSIVRDEDPGVSADELERVFEPFYSIDPSRGRYTGGTGLVLAIARSIAELNRGRLSMRNRPQAGL